MKLLIGIIIGMFICVAFYYVTTPDCEPEMCKIPYGFGTKSINKSNFENYSSKWITLENNFTYIRSDYCGDEKDE